MEKSLDVDANRDDFNGVLNLHSGALKTSGGRTHTAGVAYPIPMPGVCLSASAKPVRPDLTHYLVTYSIISRRQTRLLVYDVPHDCFDARFGCKSH
jgi:hypothetical protein